MEIEELPFFVPTSMISDMLVVIKCTGQTMDILFEVANFLSFIVSCVLWIDLPSAWNLFADGYILDLLQS